MKTPTEDLEIQKSFAQVHGLTLDESAARAHVIRPPHTENIVSSKGLQEGKPEIAFKGPVAAAYHFDVDGFGKALHAALKDSVNGYVMRLKQNGNTIYTLQWNWAKRPGDGSQGWTPAVRMHIASCSKLITGIAMTRLLNNKNMSYDTPIINWLPKYWVKGPNINKITFRHLMTHTSGFNTGVSDSDYNFMKSKVAAGVPGVGGYDYENMNFGLCRILISTVNGNISPSATFSMPLIPNWNDIMWDFTTIQAYVKYVQDHVFTPAGVSGPTLDHPAEDALAYNFPTSGSGWNSGNLASMSGGAGWHMSPDDLLAVMNAFRRKGTIMSNAQAQTMLDNGFGIDVRTSTPLGKLYNKNGRWVNGSREEQSLTYFLPQNMELVVLTNSPVGSPAKFFRDIVTDLYLANIKAS
jgi:CubicO group peptidase (beta-lactamase class C family)